MTPSRATNQRLLLAGLLTLFVCRAVIATMLVPPWQGPDEAAHFASVYRLAQGMPADRVEEQVIQSMATHRWWAAYDDEPPNPLSTVFRQLGITRISLSEPLYYFLGAGVLRASGAEDVETAYYHLRFVGIVLSIVALALGWAGTRVLFGPEIAAGASTIAALHPQFLLTSISVNSDVLLNLFGGFVWWQTARVVTGRRRGLSMAILIGGSMAALLTKRIGVLLVVMAAVVAVVSLLRDGIQVTRRRAVITGIVGLVVIAAVLLAARLAFPPQFQNFVLRVQAAFLISRPLPQATIPEAFKFLGLMLDYFWLIGGWLRFPPPELWLWVARLLILAGLGGAAIVLVESPAMRPRLSFAWLFFATQALTTITVVFWTIRGTPQARYLFPVFAAITALIYIGLQRLVPRAWHRYWPIALVVILVTLDVTGFATVHIPAYVW